MSVDNHSQLWHARARGAVSRYACAGFKLMISPVGPKCRCNALRITVSRLSLTDMEPLADAVWRAVNGAAPAPASASVGTW